MIATPEPTCAEATSQEASSEATFSARSYLHHRARQLARYAVPVLAIMLLVVSMDGRWRVASAAPKPLIKTPATKPTAPAKTSADQEPDERPAKKSASDLVGKININTASEDELMLLPTVGPAKAERIVTWRKKNGGFRRIADIRRVKGFGYKTFKRLEPFLDVKGDTTLH
jgi:competence protein ComEA